MLWITIVIVGLAILIKLLKKKSKQEKEESIFINKLEKIIFNCSASENDIHNLSQDIFIYCLNKSNKDVSFNEIKKIKNLVANNKMLYYASAFMTLKDAVQFTAGMAKNIEISDKYQTTKDTLKELIALTISNINKI